MTIDKLVPLPASRETFKRNCVKFVPEKSGCYVLTTFGNVVLYIGQAVNIRKRMVNHLDDPEKPVRLGKEEPFSSIGLSSMTSPSWSGLG